MKTMATLRGEEEESAVPPEQEITMMPATPMSAPNSNTIPTAETPDKDLCHSKEGVGSPVSTQERERATQMCSEAPAILLH